MPETLHSRKWIGRTLAVLTGLFAMGAIMWLGYTVAREMQILRSARSDNAQWSLAQTEVEFLDFANAATAFEEPPSAIRRRFDIFYSRIRTIEVADVYQILRQDPKFTADLVEARAFLDAAVSLIDLPDDAFVDQAPALRAMVSDARLTIRNLSNAGLTIFAANADAQRSAVAFTLLQLAIALAVFIGALGFAIAYLYKLNARIRRREREQNEIATRMNTVIETSLDAVVVSDSQGRVLEFNQAAEAIFGYTAAEAIGHSFTNLIVPEHHRASHDAGMRRVQNGEPYKILGQGRVRMDAMRKDGSLFPVEFSIQVAVSGADKIYVAFLRDVSSVVAAEQELVKARDSALAGEKLKTNFLTTMSHEIRTPLNGLLGNLSLLMTTRRSKRQDRYIHNMETSGRLLMNHISDVLDITRYDAGMLALDITPMNISVLLQDIVDSQSAMAETSATTLRWSWNGPRRDWVMSDPDRVQLVFMNLIGNAVKFTRRGEVTATVDILHPDDPQSPLRFRIKDTGPGIAPEFVQNIFDDFVTGNAAYDRDVGGTGLGLSIAKRFVTALGGTIVVESVEGVGSTFEVILPMTPAAAETHQHDGVKKALPGPAEPLLILIVDDNAINRTVAKDMLMAAGHHVAEAHDGLQGVKAADATRFDVILMDISMPVLDGRAAARRIKNGTGLSAQTPIIALTAHAAPDDQADFENAGMIATLTKPLSRDGLLTMLSTIGSADRHVPQDVPLVQSPAFAALRDRFVAELDALVVDLQSDDITLTDIADRAHHAAGSAATFQVEQTAAPLRDLAAAARKADDAAIDASIAAFMTAWQVGRPAFEAHAAE